MVASTEMFARVGDRRAVGYAQMVLGGALVADGCWAQALPRLRKAMQIFNALPERWGLMTCTGILAWATAEGGDWARTAILLGVAEALSERISGQLFPHMQQTADSLAARACQELGPEVEARFGEGRAIGRTDRIVAGLWPGPAAEQALPAVADLPLTRREREVAALIAKGLTNRQIGERLFIAERTVDTHVGHILARLGCASRSQVAAIVGARTLAK
jgi:DNA-binding NarL/FixJ family response regulator